MSAQFCAKCGRYMYDHSTLREYFSLPCVRMPKRLIPEKILEKSFISQYQNDNKLLTILLCEDCITKILEEMNFYTELKSPYANDFKCKLCHNNAPQSESFIVTKFNDPILPICIDCEEKIIKFLEKE